MLYARIKDNESSDNRPMKSLISHCSQSIQSKLSSTLLHEQWAQLNSIERHTLAKIVKKASSVQQVHAAEVTLTSRVIVVPVDGKHGHCNVVVWIKIINRRKSCVAKIDGRITEKFNLNTAW